MKSITLEKRALCSAMALGIIAYSATSSAATTLTFADNTSPNPNPSYNPAVSGPSNTVPYPVSNEFRVMTPYGSQPNDGFKDAIYGGEQWIFDNSNVMTGVANTITNGTNPGSCVSNPICQAPITTAITGFPICAAPGTVNCPPLQQVALFLGNDFVPLAPIAGSEAGNAYGEGTININATANTLSVFIPVVNHQYADGNYVTGSDPNPGGGANNGDKFIKGVGPGVTFNSTITNPMINMANQYTADITLYGEHVMSRDEVTVGGFNLNITQWELPGTLVVDNNAPIANDDGSAGTPIGIAGGSTNNAVDVLPNDSDPDHTVLNTTAFDTLVVNSAGSCTAGGTLTDNNTNVLYTPLGGFTGAEQCGYDIADGRGGTSGTATVFFNVSAGNQAPTAVNDGASGSPFATADQGSSVSMDVTANDSDPDGDAFSVISTDPMSANGGALTIINGGVQGGNNVQYTPVSGFTGEDSFDYTIEDAPMTGQASATVTVSVDPYPESSEGIVLVSNTILESAIPVDDPVTDTSCVGTCTQISITGVTPGNQVEILLPKLTAPIPDRFIFRHFVTSTQTWKDHEAPDSVQSAAALPSGLCPGRTSPSYGPVTVGHECVKYTVTDNDTGVAGAPGAPNDDNSIGGDIDDPVGFGQLPAPAIQQQQLSSSGCSLNADAGKSGIGHWLLIGAFISALGWLRRNRKPGVSM